MFPSKFLLQKPQNCEGVNLKWMNLLPWSKLHRRETFGLLSHIIAILKTIFIHIITYLDVSCLILVFSHFFLKVTPPNFPHISLNSKELPLLRHRRPRCLDPGIDPLAAHLTDGWWWRRRHRLRIILSATASWEPFWRQRPWRKIPVGCFPYYKPKAWICLASSKELLHAKNSLEPKRSRFGCGCFRK